MDYVKEKTTEKYTVEEYLIREAQAEYKSEYRDGEIKAMSGASLKHGILANRIGTLLDNHLDDKDCYVFNSDLKIEVAAANRYYYPDCSVACGEFQVSEKTKHAITNPKLLVEILSDSTEAFDRGEKFAHYRLLPSFQEYVLIAQHKPLVEVYTKKEAGIWQMRPVEGLEGKIILESLNCEIEMQALYKKVTFDE